MERPSDVSERAWEFAKEHTPAQAWTNDWHVYNVQCDLARAFDKATEELRGAYALELGPDAPCIPDAKTNYCRQHRAPLPCPIRREQDLLASYTPEAPDA